MARTVWLRCERDGMAIYFGVRIGNEPDNPRQSRLSEANPTIATGEANAHQDGPQDKG